jgi:hypothetical protein
VFSSTCASEAFFPLFAAIFSNHLNSCYRKKRLIILFMKEKENLLVQFDAPDDYQKKNKSPD